MAERLKLYMDEHVPKAVTEGLHRRGVDVLTAQEAGMLQATDAEQIAHAVKEGRVIFTQDADLLRLHAANVSHRGIVYAQQQTPVGQIVRGLMLIYDVLITEDMVNRVEFI